MKARALAAVLMTCTMGCMSYSSVGDRNTKVPDGSRILVECAGDQTAYLFDKVFVRSDVVVGRGMKHDRRTGRWEAFEGGIPMTSVSGVYVLIFDPERTAWLTLGLFVHALIAWTLGQRWSERPVLGRCTQIKAMNECSLHR